jgi:hypothetical protein
MSIIILQFIGIQLSGQEPVYDVGDDISVTCSTDLSVNRIVWLDDADSILMASNGSAELTFLLPSVTTAMDGMNLTCRTENNFGDQTQFFIIVLNTGGSIAVGAVVGGVVGGIIALLIVVVVIIFLICLYKRYV